MKKIGKLKYIENKTTDLFYYIEYLGTGGRSGRYSWRGKWWKGEGVVERGSGGV